MHKAGRAILFDPPCALLLLRYYCGISDRRFPMCERLLILFTE